MYYVFRSTIFLILLVLINSCQSARELHYFKSGDNYYRLQINEKSIASKSRYLSGYFDEAAVDKYFSEMGQPDSAKVVEWISNQNKNAQLVMILSTNSNSVAEQIGNLASNEELLETIAMMANKDKLSQGKLSASEMGDLKKMTGDISSAASSYFDNATTSTLKTSIKDFLNNLNLNAKGKLKLENLDSALAKYK